MKRIMSASEAETRRLAARLGKAARPGDVLALEGPLGSGKTTFTQGFARGAGFKGAVVSPSFGLARRYKTRALTLHHLDLYRLADRDLPNLGLEEYFGDPKAVCVVEWPEVAARELPADRLTIRFEHAEDGARRLTLSAAGPCSRRLLAAA